MFYKRVLLFLILLSLALSLYGLEFESYGIMGGVMYIRNSIEDSAPSPILPFLGVNTSFSFSERFFIEPSAVFNWSYFLWSEDKKMALPAEIEYADSVLLFNIMLDCPFVLKFNVNEKVALGGFVAPALIFRFPLKTWGEGDSHRSDILSYFYGGRFIFIEAGSLVEWNYSLRYSFKARLDTLLPVFNLWGDAPFSNQLTVRASITFSFKTKSARQARQAQFPELTDIE